MGDGPAAGAPTRRTEDQGYHIVFETSDHIGSTTFAGHNRHTAEVTVGLDDRPELVEALDEVFEDARENHAQYQYACRGCATPFRSGDSPEERRDKWDHGCPYCGAGHDRVEELEEWVRP